MFDNFNDFKNKISGKKVCVVGIGVSNIPLIKLLSECGAYVTACDKNENIKLEEKNVTLSLGEDYLKNLSGDYLFKSPGIRPDIPEFIKFQENGGILTSEMEVFFDVCPCKIIGITGSDGKTTTTTLISELLKDAGYNVHIGGNIGKPLLYETDKIDKDDICVIELSSFQLMTIRKSPEIAVVTNITPNHLDKHTSMQEYIDSKENIALYQNEGDILILNYDNEITHSFHNDKKSDIKWFSRYNELKSGVYYKNGYIYDDDEKILDINDIKIPGMHNVENYMAAYAAVKHLIKKDNLLNVAKKFGGVEHRIEYIKSINGVSYYNDSIASSPTRTIACINAFYEKGTKITLIAGGYDKNIPFDILGEEIACKVKKLYLVGDTKDKIKDAVMNIDRDFDITIFDSLKETVDYIKNNVQEGDVVVMSPACASFDKYKNFEERGNLFKKYILE